MTNKEKTTIDQLSSGYQSSARFDVDRGLDRLHLELGLSQQQEATVRLISTYSRRSWLAIAASMLLLVAAAIYLATSLDQNTYYAEDGLLEVALPDGSTAILNAGSQLAYSDDYGTADRKIELLGEAYFDVKPNADKPFLVSQDDVTLRVVGTTFNLMADPEKDIFEVEVSSGKVMLESKTASIPVAEKECGRVKPDRTFAKMDAPNLNRHAWKTGKMVFAATPFSEAVDIIERTYGVMIKVTQTSLDSCDFPLTATFEDVELTDVLTHLKKLTGGRFLSSESGKVYRLLDWCD